MEGTGFLGEHSDEVYHLEDDDLYLVGTSEVPLAAYHAGEILPVDTLPNRYIGWSSCFRREAGSYGKDTRGIIRVHQFNKVEMFVHTHPDQAHEEHKRLLAWERRMLDKLQLPYRIVDIAGGDLGTSAARKYDCEAWVPTQDAYRELTSTSNCTDFQARRLNIRYRAEDGKTRFAATLNGTLATTRWIVAILENHQREDGSVVVPEALRPYMGRHGTEPIQPAKTGPSPETVESGRPDGTTPRATRLQVRARTHVRATTGLALDLARRWPAHGFGPVLVTACR